MYTTELVPLDTVPGHDRVRGRPIYHEIIAKIPDGGMALKVVFVDSREAHNFDGMIRYILRGKDSKASPLPGIRVARRDAVLFLWKESPDGDVA